MDEINFLSDKSDKKRKKEKQDKSRMEWSEPVREKINAQSKLMPLAKPSKLSGWFALSKKGKKEPFSPIKTNGKSEPSNKERIELSRQEVLKAIKEDGGRKVIKEPLKEKEFKQDKPRAPEGEFGMLGSFWRAKLWRGKNPGAEKGKREIFKPPRVDKIINKHKENGVAAVSSKDEEEPIIETKEKVEKKALLSAINKERKKEWESSNILETNLIKGEFVAFFQLKKNFVFLSVFIIFACLAVAGIYGGLTFWDKQKSKSAVVDAEAFDSLNKAIEQLEKEIKEMSLFKNNLKLAVELLGNHIYWTNFFEFLEDINIPNVSYDVISFNNSGEYSFAARMKNFRAILDQVNLIRLNEYVKEAKVSGGKVSVSQGAEKESAGQEKDEEMTGVDFTLEFSIDPVLFTKGPRVAEIEPLQGAVGQYITISGINFRSYVHGKSFVKFYNNQTNTFTMADVNFPEECQNDWWRNSYIIVKVPSLMPGDWRVIVANEEGEVEYSADFQVTAGSPGPGVCLLDPFYGFEEQVINVYGDNFGQEQGFGAVEYYGGEAGKITYWSNQKITVAAPAKVQSGPLKIKTNSGGLSNSLLYKRLY
jgi:hypothetical protein